jgi:hypothetical protein
MFSCLQLRCTAHGIPAVTGTTVIVNADDLDNPVERAVIAGHDRRLKLDDFRFSRRMRRIRIRDVPLGGAQLLDRLDRTRSHHLAPGDQGAVHVRQDRGDRLGVAQKPQSCLRSTFPRDLARVLCPAGFPVRARGARRAACV